MARSLRASLTAARVTPVLLALSIAISVALAWKVHSLRAYVVALHNDTSLAIGTHVSPISAHNLDDSPATVEYGPSVPTVLYIFRPGCGWCQRNRNSFNELCSQVSGKYRVVALSLTRDEDLPRFVRENHMTIPVLADIQPMTVTEYRLGGTPTTIVVSTQGTVLKRWVGAYNEQLKREIEAYFQVHLPRLLDLPPIADGLWMAL